MGSSEDSALQIKCAFWEQSPSVLQHGEFKARGGVYGEQLHVVSGNWEQNGLEHLTQQVQDRKSVV